MLGWDLSLCTVMECCQPACACAHATPAAKCMWAAVLRRVGTCEQHAACMVPVPCQYWRCMLFLRQHAGNTQRHTCDHAHHPHACCTYLVRRAWSHVAVGHVCARARGRPLCVSHCGVSCVGMLCGVCGVPISPVHRVWPCCNTANWRQRSHCATKHQAPVAHALRFRAHSRPPIPACWNQRHALQPPACMMVMRVSPVA